MGRSTCCDAELVEMEWGRECCSRCGTPLHRPPSASQRDLIAWLFPAEKSKRPSSEAVFVRYGRRIELLRTDQVRGHPDGWAWNDL